MRAVLNDMRALEAKIREQQALGVDYQQVVQEFNALAEQANQLSQAAEVQRRVTRLQQEQGRQNDDVAAQLARLRAQQEQMMVQMQVIARGYLAYDLTGKNSALGGVMLAFGLPQLLLGPWGGVFADRLPKRNLIIATQGIIAANSLWIAVLISTGAIEYWHLVAAGVVQGAGFAFMGPARQAFTGDLVGREAIGNAVVLQQLSMNSTRVLGPSVAGAFIGISVIGIAGVYFVTTIGFFLATFTMLRLPHAVKSIFESWLERHYPDAKEKVLNRIREVRGRRFRRR